VILKKIAIETGIDRTTVIVSDLHGGNGGRADAFRAAEFSRFLRSLSWQFRLVFAGDCWELLIFSIWEIIHRYRGLLAAIMRHEEVVFLPGNHDAEFHEHGAIAEAWSSGKVLVLHGHQADRANRRPRWWTRAAAWLGGIARRLGWRADEDFVRAAREVKLVGKIRGRGAANEDYVPYLRALANSGKIGAKVVVFGHTHRPALWEEGGIVYANCGDWVEHDTAVVLTPGAVYLVRGEWAAGRETAGA